MMHLFGKESLQFLMLHYKHQHWRALNIQEKDEWRVLLKDATSIQFARDLPAEDPSVRKG